MFSLHTFSSLARQLARLVPNPTERSRAKAKAKGQGPIPLRRRWLRLLPFMRRVCLRRVFGSRASDPLPQVRSADRVPRRPWVGVNPP